MLKLPTLENRSREFKRDYQRALRDCDATAKANGGRVGGRKPRAARKPRARALAH